MTQHLGVHSHPRPQAWVIFRKGSPRALTKPSSTHSPAHHSPGGETLPVSAFTLGAWVRARDRPTGATAAATTPWPPVFPAASNLAVSSRLTDDPVSGQLLPRVTSSLGRKEHKVPRKFHKFHLVLNTPRSSGQSDPFAKESLPVEGSG